MLNIIFVCLYFVSFYIEIQSVYCPNLTLLLLFCAHTQSSPPPLSLLFIIGLIQDGLMGMPYGISSFILLTYSFVLHNILPLIRTPYYGAQWLLFGIMVIIFTGIWRWMYGIPLEDIATHDALTISFTVMVFPLWGHIYRMISDWVNSLKNKSE